jgi:PAS domain S-box-containing protein
MTAGDASEGGAQVKVLLVDDRAETLVALEAALARPDYEILKARSGQEALLHLLRGDFAVVLLDVFMPTMDGFELASLIRERERSKRTPIIFITAGQRPGTDVFRGFSVGAVDYIQKPVDADLLRTKVAVFVDLFRTKKEVERLTALLRDLEQRERERGPDDVRREDESRYRSLAEAIPEIVFTAAPDGAVDYANRRWVEYTGLAVERARGSGWTSVVHADDVKVTIARWAASIRDGAPLELELRLRRADGAYRWHLLHARPQRRNGSEVLAWVATCTDIDERRRADAERSAILAEERKARAQAEAAHRGAAFLAAASRELASSLDYAATLASVTRLAVPALADWCVVYILEEDGTIRRLEGSHVNPAKAALLSDLQRRYPLDLKRAHPVLEVIRSGIAEVVNDVSDEGLALMAIDEGHLEILRELGLRSTMVVPLMARGRTLGAVRFVNISPERRYGPEDLAIAEALAFRAAGAIDNARLYHEAKEAVAHRDQFLSVASHELRTPITSLQLHLQALLRPGAPGRPPPLVEKAIAERLRVADRLAGRLNALVDELLDVARIRGGKLDLALEPVDLAQVARDVVARLREDLARAQSEAVVRAEAPVMGHWDRLRLEQVMTNLLTNAMKYGKGKPIEIVVERADATARLSVRDNGIGIAPEDRQRIFEAFERAASPRAYGGLGLGLYIVRQIVRAHGGSIEVESRPGEGATFKVALPLELPAPSARDARARAPREAAGDGG